MFLARRPPPEHIYVEILIRAPMDALWAHTQTPVLHERWDLRFSRIDYLPRALDTEPQRFRYTTRIAFGFEVSGEGETSGQRDLTDGSRSSALRFGSDEAFSIIREGGTSAETSPAIVAMRRPSKDRPAAVQSAAKRQSALPPQRDDTRNGTFFNP